MWEYNGMYNYDPNELYHYGVKGMRWGHRKQPGYKSTSIKSAIARRSNNKVDKSFKNWNENAKKRDTAIDLGKKANVAKMAYQNDKSNKNLKSDYKIANKAYKKALKSNTTYRKGVVREQVGKDASRKYLSEAKKIKKQLTADPSNRNLQKQYNDLMSKHDIERAKARKAVAVGSKRSQRKAAFKRSMTMTVKAAATATAITAGAYAANKYLTKHQTTLNGKSIRFDAQKVSDVMEYSKKVKDFMGYMY